MRKGFALPFFGKECEPFFKEIGGGRVHFLSGVATLKICQGVRVGVVLSLIDLACRHAVAEHFFDVARGHFDGPIHFGLNVDVIPIFKVVAVASLVVHPRIGAAIELAFALVGASISLIVARARDKLGGRIFGEIVKKPLPADACTKAMTNNAMAMARDRAKM